MHIRLHVVIYIPAGDTVNELDTLSWGDRTACTTNKGAIESYYVDTTRRLWRSAFAGPDCLCRGYQVVFYQTIGDAVLDDHIHPEFLRIFEGWIPEREMALLKLACNEYNSDDDEDEKEEIDEIYCGV